MTAYPAPTAICPGAHLITVTLADGATMAAAHAGETGMAGLVPCIDYAVTEDGRPAGFLVSLPDGGRPPFDAFGTDGRWLAEYATAAAALAAMAADPRPPCSYSLSHARAGIAAVTRIECGPAGIVAACQACADFYARMGGGAEQ